MQKITCFMVHLTLALACSASHATVLFTMAPDPVSPAPRELTALTPSGVPVAVATLPDGSIGYNGGLAYRGAVGPDPERLYAVGNDPSFASVLYSFGVDGSMVSPLLSLGFGFNGGLAYHSGEDALYAIGSDGLGASTLYRVGLGGGPLVLETVGALGVGFMGGLVFNENDSTLYAISLDTGTGAQRIFNAITLGGPGPLANPRFALGDATMSFNGGLAYDADLDLFYAIANDLFANSLLATFALADAGAVVATGPSFGVGFINAGLALSPDAVIVLPPPDQLSAPDSLALSGFLALVVGNGVRRQRSPTRT